LRRVRFALLFGFLATAVSACTAPCPANTIRLSLTLGGQLADQLHLLSEHASHTLDLGDLETEDVERSQTLGFRAL